MRFQLFIVVKVNHILLQMLMKKLYIHWCTYIENMTFSNTDMVNNIYKVLSREKNKNIYSVRKKVNVDI